MIKLSDPLRRVMAASSELDRSVRIVVCIPTFRRAQHLQQTLSSIAGQKTGHGFAVVIVENDSIDRLGAAEAERFLAAGVVAGVCVLEPRQGNCRAINAAFETAQEVFPSAAMFLMLDDDEIASERWLDLMVRAAAASGVGVVGGPVFARFTDEDKQSLDCHPAFRPAYERSGPVPVIYGSGNCLITREAFASLKKPGFDLRYNFLGGGDTDFFVRCREAGVSFYWEADAVITETVPDNRTSFGWLTSRGLRIGAINYRVESNLAHGLAAHLRLVAKTLLLLPLGVFRALRLVSSGQRLTVALHPLAVSIGRALAAIGIEPRPYKASKVSS
jgi:glycosyltransferase involved in cell wall biosynthesis